MATNFSTFLRLEFLDIRRGIFLVSLNQPESQKFRVSYNRLATDENELFQALIEHPTIKNIQSFIFFSCEPYIDLYMNFHPTFPR